MANAGSLAFGQVAAWAVRANAVAELMLIMVLMLMLADADDVGMKSLLLVGWKAERRQTGTRHGDELSSGHVILNTQPR